MTRRDCPSHPPAPSWRTAAPCHWHTTATSVASSRTPGREGWGSGAKACRRAGGTHRSAPRSQGSRQVATGPVRGGCRDVALVRAFAALSSPRGRGISGGCGSHPAGPVCRPVFARTAPPAGSGLLPRPPGRRRGRRSSPGALGRIRDNRSARRCRTARGDGLQVRRPEAPMTLRLFPLDQFTSPGDLERVVGVKCCPPAARSPLWLKAGRCSNKGTKKKNFSNLRVPPGGRIVAAVCANGMHQTANRHRKKDGSEAPSPW